MTNTVTTTATIVAVVKIKKATSFHYYFEHNSLISPISIGQTPRTDAEHFQFFDLFIECYDDGGCSLTAMMKLMIGNTNLPLAEQNIPPLIKNDTHWNWILFFSAHKNIYVCWLYYVYSQCASALTKSLAWWRMMCECVDALRLVIAVVKIHLKMPLTPLNEKSWGICTFFRVCVVFLSLLSRTRILVMVLVDHIHLVAIAGVWLPALQIKPYWIVFIDNIIV